VGLYLQEQGSHRPHLSLPVYNLKTGLHHTVTGLQLAALATAYGLPGYTGVCRLFQVPYCWLLSHCDHLVEYAVTFIVYCSSDSNIPGGP